MDTTTVVIGAGHAGLAMSRCLAYRSIDHVVLERGEIANSWRTERWESLRLLTPNWQSRLPGYDYQGDDPDGFRTVPETINYIRRYAEMIAAPVVTHAGVTSVRQSGDGFLVVSTAGEWRCRTVVIASGACNLARVPALAAGLPSSITSLTPMDYRKPGQLPEGGVLVAGASATGIQLAAEIHASGRPVTLAVGGHIRAPRTYRGKDIQWWLDASGVQDEFYTSVDDIERARSMPSFQLVGSDDRRTIDLNALSVSGVKLVGRVAGRNGARLQFSGSLGNQCALSDLKMNRLLDRIDAWAAATAPEAAIHPPERFGPTRVDDSPRLELDLDRGEIRSIVWATGFRPDYSWLHVPVLDRKGRIDHDGGVTRVPGMYLMGAPFLRRRKSTLIDGAADDARDLSAILARYLAHPAEVPSLIAAG
ncbi:MAG: NAD(P)-binding domain-containing protein [Dehalococcoidia bacterium]|nr:NAD(P)-binding domain-containing protein [Dehalococcoidia bacterium]